MRPIGWSRRSVQLECETCGAHQRLEFLPYLTALKAGVPLQCHECGAEAIPQDRRRQPATRAFDRRFGVPATG